MKIIITACFLVLFIQVSCAYSDLEDLLSGIADLISSENDTFTSPEVTTAQVTTPLPTTTTTTTTTVSTAKPYIFSLSSCTPFCERIDINRYKIPRCKIMIGNRMVYSFICAQCRLTIGCDRVNPVNPL